MRFAQCTTPYALKVLGCQPWIWGSTLAHTIPNLMMHPWPRYEEVMVRWVCKKREVDSQVSTHNQMANSFVKWTVSLQEDHKSLGRIDFNQECHGILCRTAPMSSSSDPSCSRFTTATCSNSAWPVNGLTTSPVYKRSFGRLCETVLAQVASP